MLQVLRYFVKRGWNVDLVAESPHWDNSFDPQAAERPIKVHKLNMPQTPGGMDRLWRRIFRSADRDFAIGAQRAFSHMVGQITPDLILINYCTGMNLIAEDVRVPVIVDTHDFLSMSGFLSSRARSLIDEKASTFEPLADARKAFVQGEDYRNEVEQIRKANLVLGISKADSATFAKLTGSPVLTFNYYEPSSTSLAVSAASLRAVGLMPIGTGDNPHNVLGTMLLDKAFQRAGVTSTTPLVIGSGRVSKELKLGEWFEPAGEIVDYQSYVGQFAYGICPAFWGTGAQIKQYEFAARGMPVVGYRDTLDLDLWMDDYNAIFVSTPEELRSAIVGLSNDWERLAKLRRGAARLPRTLMERNTLQERELDAYVDQLIGACV
jgi:hypothetical protein